MITLNISTKEKKINKHVDKAKRTIVELFCNYRRKQGGQNGCKS
jgi:hypothetical protein